MSKIDSAVSEIHRIDESAARDQWMNRIHPLVKLLLTTGYLIAVVSFGKYNLAGVAGMVIYLIFGYELSEIKVRTGMKRLRLVLPLIILMAAANPFLDRSVMADWSGFAVTGGVISMLTMICKGIFALLAGYLLIATASMEKICYALRQLRVPKILVTVILLIYRYISVLLEETDRMNQAYMLRAPGQKGIHYSAWGTFAGQLLLRSIDRAQEVYESMCLRGYAGEFAEAEEMKFQWRDGIVFLIGAAGILTLRFVPVFEMMGGLFG